MFRRFLAYFFDTMLILLCVQIISNNSFINRDIDKYMEVNTTYVEKNSLFSDATLDINEIYDDKEVTKEEREKFNKEYKDINLEIKENDKLEDVLKLHNTEYLKFTNNNNYLLTKYNMIGNIATIILFIIYFGYIPYVFDGQTLGKKIFKLRVESIDDKELSLGQMMIRSLIYTGVVFSTLEIILFFILKQNIYMSVDMVIVFIASSVEMACYLTVLFRQDHRGLHDLLTHTKVIDLKQEILVEE